MDTLTDRQISILCAIGAGHYIYSDLMAWLFIPKTTLKYHLSVLRSKGFVIYVFDRQGTLRLTDKSRDMIAGYGLRRDVKNQQVEVIRWQLVRTY